MLLYFDGFDSYVTADLLARYNIATGAMNIVAGAGRFGSGAIQCNQGGGGDVLAKFLPPRTGLVAGVAWLYVLTAVVPNIKSKIIQFSDINIGTGGADGGGGQVEVGINNSSILEITSNNGATVLATGTTVLSQSTYYFIELKVNVATGTGGSAYVCLNGAPEVSVTGVNTDPQLTTNVSRVILCYDFFRVLPSFDDFYICDLSGSRNNDFLGDVRVETQLPISAGNYSQFTVHGGLGANYQAVDEATEDGDTSYVYTQTVNDIDSYVLSAISSAADTVLGVQMISVARKDDAGIRTLKQLIRISSTDYLGNQIPVTDTYTYCTQVYELNPHSGSPWTAGDLAALEVGVKLIS